MRNQKKFKEMITVLCERYDKAPSQILSKMIWEALKPHSDEICIDAFNHVFLRGRFFKDIVPDLNEFIEKEQNDLDESVPAIEADRVIAHLNAHGGSAPLPANDPITGYLMTSRWPYQTWAAGVLTKDIVWWRKDFIEAYKNRKLAGVPRQIEASPEVKRLVQEIVDGQE